MQREIFTNIYFVGYVDWTLMDFHSFETKRGVTYNSYLIKDEKIALIDTVKLPFAADLEKNITSVASLDKIDFIIVNHAEPDHSGSLFEIVKKCKNAKVVCTQKCKDTLGYYFDIAGWNFQIVKTSDVLSLGKRTLEFIETPMLHWPESMATYLREDKILFSMDAFGQHFSFSKLFDDEVDICAMMDEAKKYYANIIMPYGRVVLNVLDKLSKYEIKAIAPAHGVIWRKNISLILDMYKKWASFTPEAKVTILYDTMWQSTKLMAESIVKGAESANVEVKLLSVRTSPLTDISAEVLDSASVAFGSATLNMGMMPMMGAVLTYLKGLSPKNKIGAVFGTHGWGRGAVEAMSEQLKAMDFEMVEPVNLKWKPDEKGLKLCYDMGKSLAEKTLKKVGKI